MAEDYYKTLGVTRGASQAEIDKAYSTLARKFHPDLNPDDKSAKKKFQAVQAAYDVLKDPSKREMYDRYGDSFEAVGGGPRGGPQRRGGPKGEDFDFSQFFGERYGEDPSGGFADIFSQFRRAQGGQGRRGRSAGRPAGVDAQIEVQIPFSVSITGGEVQVVMPRQNGQTENLSVKIPAGIEDGKRIRLRGQGESSAPDGPRGDLLIQVRVAPHPWFTRRGEHLHVKVPVTLLEAAEGAKVDVPTPKGVVALRVPKGTSSGARLRIKGHGVSLAGKAPGDLFAEIQIVLPANLDEPSLELIRKFEARQPQQPRRELRW